MHKPFSQACENNQAPIADILHPYFTQVPSNKMNADKTFSVLEIGSGTGQHACYFANTFPHITWQPSDQACYLEGITAWVTETNHPNLRAPMALDVATTDHLPSRYSAIFTANTLHIMSPYLVETFFQRLENWLQPPGWLFIYGPFKFDGHFTSHSNQRFDEHLKSIEPNQGIRDFEWLSELAEAANLKLQANHHMPANNQLLVWQHKPPKQKDSVAKKVDFW